MLKEIGKTTGLLARGVLAHPRGREAAASKALGRAVRTGQSVALTLHGTEHRGIEQSRAPSPSRNHESKVRELSTS